MTLKVKLAEPKQAEQILEMLRHEFLVDYLEYTIYGYAGIIHYLKDACRIQHFGNNPLFVVCCDQNENLVGTAEIRRSVKTLFLNHIAVLSTERGKGIGKHLLFQAIEIAKAQNHQFLELDVFAENIPAKNWYVRLGLNIINETVWKRIKLGENFLGCKQSWTTPDIIQADFVHNHYGFSMFTVKTDNQHYSVGRLGTQWYRVTDSDILQNPIMLDALYSLDQNRKILYIGNDSPVVSAGELLARSYRMSAPLRQVMKHLQ